MSGNSQFVKLTEVVANTIVIEGIVQFRESGYSSCVYENPILKDVLKCFKAYLDCTTTDVRSANTRLLGLVKTGTEYGSLDVYRFVF